MKKLLVICCAMTLAFSFSSFTNAKKESSSYAKRWCLQPCPGDPQFFLCKFVNDGTPACDPLIYPPGC